ncbi:MAG TPA: ferrochelatase [Chloroflexia bacterium]|nr:ferrochelatase [Chloroflexia bacterium]
METAAPIGVLLMAYGTPDSLDDVEPYYTHIRGGKRPPDDKLEDLRARYRRVGGQTPLLAITQATAAGLQAQLDGVAPGRYRVYIGMKHWHPYIGPVVAGMVADGVRQILAIPLAPHYSRLSIGGYRQAVDAALAPLVPPIAVTFVERWHDNALWRALIADRVREARTRLPAGPDADLALIFSAHSLPERIREWHDPYPDELQASAAGIAELLGTDAWRFAFQSAGMTGEPWLGPDILDVLAGLPQEGKRRVLVAPIGFVCDHLEILYDIDVECQETAAAHGLTLVRTNLPNATPEFIAVLADLVAQYSRVAAAP